MNQEYYNQYVRYRKPRHVAPRIDLRSFDFLVYAQIWRGVDNADWIRRELELVLPRGLKLSYVLLAIGRLKGMALVRDQSPLILNDALHQANKSFSPAEQRFNLLYPQTLNVKA